MTWRTLTKSDAKFSLVFFPVDETFSIVETRKLEATQSDKIKEWYSKVNIKIGRDMVDGEIIMLNDNKSTLEAVLDDIQTDPVYGKFVLPPVQPLSTGTRESEATLEKNVLEEKQESGQTAPICTAKLETPPKKQKLLKRKADEMKQKKEKPKKQKTAILISLEDPPEEPENDVSHSTCLIGSSYSLSVDDRDRSYLSSSFMGVNLTGQSTPKRPPGERPECFEARSLPGGVQSPAPITPNFPSPIIPNFPTSIAHSSQTEHNAILLKILDVCKETMSCVQALKSEMYKTPTNSQFHSLASEQDRSPVLPLPSYQPPVAFNKPAAVHTPATRRSLTTSLEHTAESEMDLFCVDTRSKTSSVGLFAKKLTEKMFTIEERENRNCLGKKGKEPLDPVKLNKIKQLVFKYYDVHSREHDSVWKQCIVRIDEFLRRKPKSKQ